MTSFGIPFPDEQSPIHAVHELSKDDGAELGISMSSVSDTKDIDKISAFDSDRMTAIAWRIGGISSRTVGVEILDNTANPRAMALFAEKAGQIIVGSTEDTQCEVFVEDSSSESKRIQKTSGRYTA